MAKPCLCILSNICEGSIFDAVVLADLAAKQAQRGHRQVFMSAAIPEALAHECSLRPYVLRSRPGLAAGDGESCAFGTSLVAKGSAQWLTPVTCSCTQIQASDVMYAALAALVQAQKLWLVRQSCSSCQGRPSACRTRNGPLAQVLDMVWDCCYCQRALGSGSRVQSSTSRPCLASKSVHLLWLRTGALAQAGQVAGLPVTWNPKGGPA